MPARAAAGARAARKRSVGNPEHTLTVRATRLRYAARMVRGARGRRSGARVRARPAWWVTCVSGDDKRGPPVFFVGRCAHDFLRRG
ncbi:hypothetical protein MYA_2763 [Burkholderia sp. KJ006]|nr:hypothetical protein MYA_2763 [Burkholderia sp. KJ006]